MRRRFKKSINIGPEHRAMLERLAEEEQRTHSAIVRRAIALYADKEASK